MAERDTENDGELSGEQNVGKREVGIKREQENRPEQCRKTGGKRLKKGTGQEKEKMEADGTGRYTRIRKENIAWKGIGKLKGRGGKGIGKYSLERDTLTERTGRERNWKI